MNTHYFDFGGQGEPLHLAPANGFPPEAYRPLAAALVGQFHTLGYRPRPLRPGSSPAAVRSWRDLAAEMIDDIRGLGAAPLLGVGHSLGGILTLYAALRAPELFRAIVLIDSVILPRRTLPLVWMARLLRQQRRMPLVRGALRRRDRFSSLDDARARLRGRGAFAALSDAALEGYLEGGLRPDGDELILAWPKLWEAHIFGLVPIDTWAALRRLRVPLLLIRGTRTDLLIDRSWHALQRRLPRAAFAEVEGSHMVPLERPVEVAARIMDWASGDYSGSIR